MKRVIRYLKGTKDAKLVLGRGGTLTWEEGAPSIFGSRAEPMQLPLTGRSQ